MRTNARRRVVQKRLGMVALSGAVALSGGCMVGPDYVKPKAEVVRLPTRRIANGRRPSRRIICRAASGGRSSTIPS